MDLLIAPFRGGFGFVQALEGAIVALIKTPGIVLREIVLAKFAKAEIHRAVRPFEDGGEGNVEVVALLFEKLTGGFGFVDAGFGEVDIRPAGEEVLQIPFGLAMAEQD
jgi:hypothetical protein